MAALAASLAKAGPGKSGNPWPRLTAPCWLANRLISVNTEVPKPRTRGDATCLVRSADSLAARSCLEGSTLCFEPGARPTSPGVTCRISLRLRAVLTKNGAQGVDDLAERCSGAQRFSH